MGYYFSLIQLLAQATAPTSDAGAGSGDGSAPTGDSVGGAGAGADAGSGGGFLNIDIPIPNIFETFFAMLNDWLCSVIDVILSIWPSTPESLNVGALVAQSFNDSPIGSAIVAETFNTILGVLALVTFVKIYKLIPFKAT